MIIGCDFHPSWQQVCWLDTETGESGEQKLVQASGDAGRFYRQVAAPALIGMEATGNCHWLVDLLAEIGHELWVGDAASSCQSNRPCRLDIYTPIAYTSTCTLLAYTTPMELVEAPRVYPACF